MFKNKKHMQECTTTMHVYEEQRQRYKEIISYFQGELEDLLECEFGELFQNIYSAYKEKFLYVGVSLESIGIKYFLQIYVCKSAGVYRVYDTKGHITEVGIIRDDLYSVEFSLFTEIDDSHILRLCEKEKILQGKLNCSTLDITILNAELLMEHLKGLNPDIETYAEFCIKWEERGKYIK